jgi:hypothetical protein
VTTDAATLAATTPPIGLNELVKLQDELLAEACEFESQFTNATQEDADILHPSPAEQQAYLEGYLQGRARSLRNAGATIGTLIVEAAHGDKR